MKAFISQFLPALCAGLIVLTVSFYLTRPTVQAGLLVYDNYGAYISKQDVLNFPKNVFSTGEQIGVISIYNPGKSDLKDIEIDIGKFRGVSEPAKSITIKPEFRNVVAKAAITASSVDQNGILRIKIARFSPNGLLRLLIVGNIDDESNFDVTDNNIAMKNIQTYMSDEKLHDSTIPGFLAAFASFATSIFAVLVTFYFSKTNRRTTNHG